MCGGVAGGRVTPIPLLQLTIGELHGELAMRVYHTDGRLASLGHTVVLNSSLYVPVPLGAVLGEGQGGGRRVCVIAVCKGLNSVVRERETCNTPPVVLQSPVAWQVPLAWVHWGLL